MTDQPEPIAPLIVRRGLWEVTIYDGTATLPAFVSVNRRSDGMQLAYVEQERKS